MYYSLRAAAETMPDWAKRPVDEQQPTEAYVGSCWHTLWAVTVAGACAQRPRAGDYCSGVPCSRMWRRGKSRARPANVFGDGLFHGIMLHVAVDDTLGQQPRASKCLDASHDAVWLRGMWVLANQDLADGDLAKPERFRQAAAC